MFVTSKKLDAFLDVLSLHGNFGNKKGVFRTFFIFLVSCTKKKWRRLEIGGSENGPNWKIWGFETTVQYVKYVKYVKYVNYVKYVKSITSCKYGKSVKSVKTVKSVNL